MDHLNQELSEDTAKVYAEMLVPDLFREWAERLAKTDEINHFTREVNKKLTKGSITGLDPNPGMLSVAKQKAPDITWHLGTAEKIPFSSENFDVVISQFGLMLFSSPKAGLLEMKRVL